MPPYWRHWTTLSVPSILSLIYKIRRGRGMAQKSRDLIDAMYAAAESAQPITGRGIGYKLFV